MKQKKRSPEAISAAKSAYRSRVDRLRRTQTVDSMEELRQIDGQWPRGLTEALDGPYDDPSALDTLLRFLEDDPYFRNSGYLKEIALRRLSRWTLDVDDRRRIARIVLSAVDGPTAREFRRQCKAARLADRETLVPGLLARLQASDEALRQRAYCAGIGMFEEEWPYDRYRPVEEVRARIDAMRDSLRALPEAR